MKAKFDANFVYHKNQEKMVEAEFKKVGKVFETLPKHVKFTDLPKGMKSPVEELEL